MIGRLREERGARGPVMRVGMIAGVYRDENKERSLDLGSVDLLADSSTLLVLSSYNQAQVSVM